MVSGIWPLSRVENKSGHLPITAKIYKASTSGWWSICDKGRMYLAVIAAEICQVSLSKNLAAEGDVTDHFITRINTPYHSHDPLLLKE